MYGTDCTARLVYVVTVAKAARELCTEYTSFGDGGTYLSLSSEAVYERTYFVQ